MGMAPRRQAQSGQRRYHEFYAQKKSGGFRREGGMNSECFDEKRNKKETRADDELRSDHRENEGPVAPVRQNAP